MVHGYEHCMFYGLLYHMTQLVVDLWELLNTDNSSDNCEISHHAHLFYMEGRTYDFS